MGADVSYYVPNRFNDGYGPNMAQYQRLASEGMQLLITVDNGVSGREEVNWLMANGVDVIVTDHHELPDLKDRRMGNCPPGVVGAQQRRHLAIVPAIRGGRSQ